MNASTSLEFLYANNKITVRNTATVAAAAPPEVVKYKFGDMLLKPSAKTFSTIAKAVVRIATPPSSRSKTGGTAVESCSTEQEQSMDTSLEGQDLNSGKDLF